MGVTVGLEITEEEVLNNDFVVAMIDKNDVIACDLKHIGEIAHVLESCGVQAKQKVLFLFMGFDNVPEEIYEIQEIRKFVSSFIEKFPHAIYWLSTVDNYDKVFLACLGDTTSVKEFKGESQSTQQMLDNLEALLNPSKFCFKFVLKRELRERLIKKTIFYALSHGESEESIMAQILNLFE